MTRIVAGAARGRRLSVPTGTATRPTSDRAREGLFSTLESMLGSVGGRRVLDLYAGSGAVGLEALSRGAAHVHLVESERRAHAAVTANVAAVGLPGATVSRASVERLVAEPNQGPAYDVVVLDPPYSLAASALAAVLADVLANGWLAPGGVAVVERATRDPAWAWPTGFAEDRSRAYGEATVWYGRAAGRTELRSQW